MYPKIVTGECCLSPHLSPSDINVEMRDTASNMCPIYLVCDTNLDSNIQFKYIDTADIENVIFFTPSKFLTK